MKQPVLYIGLDLWYGLAGWCFHLLFTKLISLVWEWLLPTSQSILVFWKDKLDFSPFS